MGKYNSLARAVELLAEERETTNELREINDALRSSIRRYEQREKALLKERATLMAENVRLYQEIEELRCTRRVTVCL